MGFEGFIIDFFEKCAVLVLELVEGSGLGFGLEFKGFFLILEEGECLFDSVDLLDDQIFFKFVLFDLRRKEIVFSVDHLLTKVIKIVDFFLDLIKGEVILILSCANNLIKISFVTVVLQTSALNFVLEGAELLVEDLLAAALSGFEVLGAVRKVDG